MDRNRSSVWHFGFPLKLWIWRFFHLTGHGAPKRKQQLPHRVFMAQMKERRGKREWRCFHLVRKGYECDASWWRQRSCLVWNANLFTGGWTMQVIEMMNRCSSYSEVWYNFDVDVWSKRGHSNKIVKTFLKSRGWRASSCQDTPPCRLVWTSCSIAPGGINIVVWIWVRVVLITVSYSLQESIFPKTSSFIWHSDVVRGKLISAQSHTYNRL